MILCEKCKTLGSPKILRNSEGEKVCPHIYQRRYYAANKEKAREYQRQYQATRRKSSGCGRGRSKSTFIRLQVPEKKEYNSSDLMHLSVDKWPMVVGNIANGYYLFKP